MALRKTGTIDVLMTSRRQRRAGRSSGRFAPRHSQRACPHIGDTVHRAAVARDDIEEAAEVIT